MRKLTKCLVIGTLLSIAFFNADSQVYIPVIADKASSESPVQNNSSLSNILNADGTVKPGVEGSFNVKGYNMSFAADGAPLFTQERLNSCNTWDPRFSLGAVDGYVHAVAISGSNIYVAGEFWTIGGITVYCIAKWDGTSWSALGDGTVGDIYTIAVVGNNVYVGGDFPSIGGNSAAKYIAVWNGSTWNALGTGVNNWVETIVASGGNLYVGGHFSTAGGSTANKIAVWNGSTWSTLGTGITSGIDINTIALSGTDVYVGGDFTVAGGNPANFVAKWNGSTWSGLGSGVNAEVQSIAISGTDVYVGGSFTTAGGNPASRIAIWNGSTWTVPGGGVNGGVTTIFINGGNVYVGGYFSMAGATPANNIAVWNGTSWSAMGSGVDNTAFFITANGSDIYAVGNFLSAGGEPAARIAVWNGTDWNEWGNTGTADGQKGLSQPVYAMAVKDGKIYVGGKFRTINNIDYFAMWDGVSWSAPGGGANDIVFAITIDGNNVYIGGQFFGVGDGAGYVNARNIAKWDGTVWSSLGIANSQLDGTVYAIAVSGSTVYAGGSLNGIFNIAKWNGTLWSQVGPFGVNSTVRALAMRGTDLIVGGDFSPGPGGVSNARYLAVWNGTNWSALGTGVNNAVHSIWVDGNNIYAGGNFITAGGVTVNRIAKWNGAVWSGFGTGVNNTVKSIFVNGSNVYIGGNFTTAGGNTANRIAVWDGTAWSSFGTGINNNVNAIVVNGDAIAAGGTFTHAGGKLSANFAIYTTDLHITLNEEDTMICTPSSPVQLTASGGTSYTWSPATGLSATTGTTVTATPAVTTTYTVTGTNGVCSASASVTISVGPPVLSVPANDTTICLGSSVTYTAYGAGNFSWTGPNVNATGAIVTIQPASAGVFTYTLTGTTDNCSSTLTRTITVTALPDVTINASATTVCSGDLVTFTSTGATSYAWAGPALNAFDGPTVTGNPLAVGGNLYSVTGTSNGCSKTAYVMISVKAKPIIGIPLPDSTICLGSAVTYTVNGAGSYDYLWTGPNVNSPGSSVTIQPASAGVFTYTVTASSIDNCSATLTRTITVNAGASLQIPQQDTTICLGGSVTYTASGATSYTWTGPNVNSTNAQITVSPNPPGVFVYTVTGTTNNCTATLTRTVTVKSLPPVVMNATLTNLCPGSSSTLTASGATTYTWSGQGLNTTTGASVIATPPAVGTFMYEVTGTDNGCSETAAMMITVNSLPIVNITQNDTAICTGSSVQLTATGAVLYTWTPATGLSATNTATVIAAPSAPITYTVTGSNNEGCVASDMVTISLLPVVTPSVAIDYTGCPANTLMFTVTPGNGGTNPTYQWLVNNVASGTGSTFTLNNAVNGMQVSVVMTSSVTCLSSPTATQSVTVNCITTAVPNIDGLETYFIAPNPTSGLFRVEMKLSQARKVSFSLMDAFGKEIYQSPPANLSGTIIRPVSLEGKAAGVYFLKVMVGKEFFVERIVKVE